MLRALILILCLPNIQVFFTKTLVSILGQEDRKFSKSFHLLQQLNVPIHVLLIKCPDCFHTNTVA